MNKVRLIIDFLSGAKSLHYVMPVIILYLIIGTIAQKYVGLYEATSTYFYSPIIWLGFVPLPGFPLLLGVIFISLCANLIFKSLWSLKNTGIIITHIGVMLLIGGGFVTGLFSQEGYLDLAEGQNKQVFYDYHERELVLLDSQGKTVFATPFDTLFKGQTLDISAYDLTLNIINICRNCGIAERKDFMDEVTYHSMAAHMQLFDKKPEMKNEENMGGVLMNIISAPQSEETGVYVVLEDVPKLPRFTIKDATYSLALRKKMRKLPFDIELLEFKKDVHPGTQMAKAYQSRVRIYDNESVWESVIRMNEPLRYKGYSFYQSSFLQTPDGEISVLAVVKNAGRSFPYIASIAMCIGLILHLFMRRRFADKSAKDKSS